MPALAVCPTCTEELAADVCDAGDTGRYTPTKTMTLVLQQLHNISVCVFVGGGGGHKFRFHRDWNSCVYMEGLIVERIPKAHRNKTP